MCPDSNFNICTGWTQEWISSKKLQKDKHLDIQEIVRGPFSSPRLLKTCPLIVFSSCPQQNENIEKNYCNIRRGIPDTWKEYLACKGFCNTIEKYILQKNLISSCVRYFATDKIWTDTGLHFTQGIPDPWKCKSLTTSQCIKYPRAQYSRAKNICSTRKANTYDGDDEAKTKTISKGCPKCEQQLYLITLIVPVACKACPCGHSFFNARRNSIKSPPSPDNGVMKTRRTNRIKREKPNYYDALEYDKQSKKSAKGKGKGKSGSNNGIGDDDDEMEGINSLSPEKQLTCSLILQELNNKMRVVAWKPT
ncbi:hypothetical protein APICC_09519 [Apis cerana cerana]|uniref:Uncharacterized protein n=1 Tax=Apis cerana cerana TaxID=94128 RepID=A0A2A3E387_APICC|nr:hypothetical protein APICC_09519 [Apis cerana cerana]